MLHELAWESRVTAPHIGVTSEQGVVTLTGTVTSYAERLAAQAAAHRVAGVLDVANELQVRLVSGLARTDSEGADRRPAGHPDARRHHLGHPPPD